MFILFITRTQFFIVVVDFLDRSEVTSAVKPSSIDPYYFLVKDKCVMERCKFESEVSGSPETTSYIHEWAQP